MVQAWYMDDAEGDQCLPHRQEPNADVSLEKLAEIGVLYFQVSGPESDEFKKLCADRGYNYQDQICLTKEKFPNLDDMLKKFFEEHIHDDEEIRLCVDGSGYFDVRDKQDKWIRVHLFPGDLIILPAGIYHRFTLDESKYITARRMFVGEPVWTPYNRPCDEREARKQYVHSLSA